MTTKMEAKVNAMLDGVTKAIPATSTLSVDGMSMSQPALLKELAGYAGLYTATDAGRQQYRTALAAQKAAASRIHALLLALDASLRTLFGKGSPALAQFGLVPKGSSKAPTPATKTIAVAKRQATRKARNTVGKAVRLTITANPRPTLTVSLPHATLAPVGSPAGSPVEPPAAASTSTPPQK